MITAIADLRTTNRSTAIDVTLQFKSMTDRFPLVEMREYFASRFPFKRGKDSKGNYEYTFIEEVELKTFDKRFFRMDRLVLGFQYNSDGTATTKFQATLVNGQV